MPESELFLDVDASRLTRRWRLWILARYLLVIALSSALAFLGAHFYASHKSAGLDAALRVHALRAMTESQLRQTVVANHLIVYWAGPSQGSNYLLDTVEANVIVLTILPPGQHVAQTRTSYPQFATYVLKNAFQAVLSGGNNPSVGGFINADGNSVFFSSLDPKNVFVGIRGEDVEVQIFHPAQGMSLDIAQAAGRLVPIIKANS
jgi:hypothetical protein